MLVLAGMRTFATTVAALVVTLAPAASRADPVTLGMEYENYAIGISLSKIGKRDSDKK